MGGFIRKRKLGKKSHFKMQKYIGRKNLAGLWNGIFKKTKKIKCCILTILDNIPKISDQ